MAYRDFLDNEDQKPRDPYAPLPPGAGAGAASAAPAPSTTPSAAAAPSLGAFTSGMNPDQVRTLANQYISTGGANNIDNGQYWVDKYSQWGGSDPNYFTTRLKQGINDNSNGKNYFADVGNTPANAAQQTPGYMSTSQAAGLGGFVGSAGTGVDPSLREALLGLMNRSKPGAIDPTTDPNLGPQSRAYAAARERSANKERAATAERAAFTGLNSGGQGSGAFTSGLQGIQENAGRDIASNDAGLVGQEVQARRQDLMGALQLANAIGARDQSASIQQQLAQLDNTYRYASLGQQNNQFYSQLGQQQGQFNDNYGLNRAQLQADTDRNAILAALGR